MTGRVDCGDCPGVAGCVAGHCMRARVAQREEATRRGQLELELLLDPARAERKARENDRRALELQRQHQDCLDFRAL